MHRETGEPVVVGRVEAMSKSKRNTVDPEAIITRYGADTARWFILSDNPPERDMEWTEAGVAGGYRFTQRLYPPGREFWVNPQRPRRLVMPPAPCAA